MKTKLQGTRARSKLLSVAVAALLSLSLSACGSFKFRTGSRPALHELDQLTVGLSTADDVESLLGPPFGKGRARLPFQDGPTDLWSYYYEEGTLEDDRRTFLLVYLDEEVLDGYMWFGSLPGAEGR